MEEALRLIIGQRVTADSDIYPAHSGRVGTVTRYIEAPMLSDHGYLLVVDFGYEEYAFDLHELDVADEHVFAS